MSTSDPTQVDTATLLKSLERDMGEFNAHMMAALRWHQEARATVHELQLRAHPRAEGGERTAEFEVVQDDEVVAETFGPRERALADAMHYAAVYGQDGPVIVQEVFRTAIFDSSAPAQQAEGEA